MNRLGQGQRGWSHCRERGLVPAEYSQPGWTAVSSWLSWPASGAKRPAGRAWPAGQPGQLSQCAAGRPSPAGPDWLGQLGWPRQAGWASPASPAGWIAVLVRWPGRLAVARLDVCLASAVAAVGADVPAATRLVRLGRCVYSVLYSVSLELRSSLLSIAPVLN